MSLEAVGGRGGGGGGGTGLFISIPLSSLLKILLLLFSLQTSEFVEVMVVVRCLAKAIPTGMFVLESSIEDTESGEVTVSLLRRFFTCMMEYSLLPLVEAGLVNKESLGL